MPIPKTSFHSARPNERDKDGEQNHQRHFSKIEEAQQAKADRTAMNLCIDIDVSIEIKVRL
ncbi:hypothetical protein N8525_02980 [Verrucomicrobiales bacterium]|nr:hypothetical protein [Verrucomicrobiales bacterium]